MKAVEKFDYTKGCFVPAPTPPGGKKQSVIRARSGSVQNYPRSSRSYAGGEAVNRVAGPRGCCSAAGPGTFQ